MLYGSVRFRWKEETPDNIVHDVRRARLVQLFGYLDTDRDGGLAPDELPRRMQEALRERFSSLDGDGNGTLSIDEYSQINRRAQ